jgi:hypothetical protein
MKNLFFDWEVNDHTGWGIYGLNLLIHGVANKKIRPVSLIWPPKINYPLDPITAIELNQLIKDWKKIAHNKSEDIFLNALGNSSKKLYEKEVRFKQTELETTGKKLPKPADPMKEDGALNRYLNDRNKDKNDKKDSPDKTSEKLNDYVGKFSEKILKGVKKQDSNLLLLNEYQNNLDTIKNNTDELKELSSEEELDSDQIARKKILLKELNDLPIENEQVKKKFYNENRKAFESNSLKAILNQKDVSSIFLGYADGIFNSALENYTGVSGEVQETKIPTIPQSEFIPPEKSGAALLPSKQEIKRTEKNQQIGVVDAQIAALQTQISKEEITKEQGDIKIAELKKEKEKLFSDTAG